MALDFGHRAEELLPVALSRLGVVIVNSALVGTDPGVPLALARASEREDWEEGTDFWFFVRGRGWFRLDLTTARNWAVLLRKRARARRDGVILVEVSGGTLERAARGCHRDLKTIAGIFEAVIAEIGGG